MITLRGRIAQINAGEWDDAWLTFVDKQQPDFFALRCSMQADGRVLVRGIHGRRLVDPMAVDTVRH